MKCWNGHHKDEISLIVVFFIFFFVSCYVFMYCIILAIRDMFGESEVCVTSIHQIQHFKHEFIWLDVNIYFPATWKCFPSYLMHWCILNCIISESVFFSSFLAQQCLWQRSKAWALFDFAIDVNSNATKYRDIWTNKNYKWRHLCTSFELCLKYK